MVRKRVYRTRRNATTGRPTRYQVWIDVGKSSGGKKRAGKRKRRNPLDQAFTKVTTFLRSVGGGTKRRTTSRRKGWSTGDVHPNRYRRHAQPPPASGVDEVARQRQRRRNRGKR